MRLPSLKTHIRRSWIRLAILLACGIVLVVVGLFQWLGSPQPDTYRLRISGGIEGLNRHGLARFFKRHADDIDLKVEIVGSEGTVGATRLVQQGDLDLALVNGLLRSPQSTSVRQVAAITVEALHLLVKTEHADHVEADLGEMKRLVVNLGPVGTETEQISRAFLNFCGVSFDQSGAQAPRIERQSLTQLLGTLDKIEQTRPDGVDEVRDRLPDVVIHVSSLPSALAKRMIQIGKYRLVPAPFTDAFSRITVEEEELDRDHLDQLHVVPVTIPAYMYGASPPQPVSDCPTFGCPLILIVNEQVPAEVVSRLLPHLYEGPLERVYHPPPINRVPATYPWHAASLAFRDRNKPLLKADIADTIQKFFSMLAPLLGGCLAIYGYFRWRQTLRFIQYFEQHQALDDRAKGLTPEEAVTPMDTEEVRRVEISLAKLQQQAVNDFCRNYFYGDGVFRNLVSLLAETRNYIRTTVQKSRSAEEGSPSKEEPPS